MKKLIAFLTIVMLAGAVAFAGGQGEAEQEEMGGGFAWLTETGDFVDVNPLEVEGNIVTAGSSTVFPAAEVLAARFSDEGYAGTITVDSVGSGGGFERFTAGETDISNASRPIEDGEIAAAEANGINPIEFTLGTDALAVVVSTENDWISDATIEELATIMTSDRWSDVDPDWPDEPIEKFIPGTDSGTFDYFVEMVFEEDSEPILNASNLQLSENDNILVQGVEGSPNAIAFFGYAYYVEEQDRLKILSIEGVEASGENVDNGTYPLARPLFMYSDAEIMRSKPQVAAFLAFVINNATSAMREVGYFAASDRALEESRRSWLEAMEGTY
ncbi:MAG: phosphate ABC transporter substrate-binding protein PstS family protein [Alkalispirochaetaceae bacterium]